MKKLILSLIVLTLLLPLSVFASYTSRNYTHYVVYQKYGTLNRDKHVKITIYKKKITTRKHK